QPASPSGVTRSDPETRSPTEKRMMIADKLLAFTLLGAGWVLWLLIGLSMVSVAVIVERALYFARRGSAQSYPQLLLLAQAGNLEEAARIATGDAMEA